MSSVLWEPNLSYPFAPMSLLDPSVKLRWFWRGTRLLHWDRFGTQKVEGIRRTRTMLWLLILWVKVLVLEVDLVDLRWG